jgi:hypothetical protein
LVFENLKYKKMKENKSHNKSALGPGSGSKDDPAFMSAEDFIKLAGREPVPGLQTVIETDYHKQVKKDYQEFYQKFGIQVDFSTLSIPPYDLNSHDLLLFPPYGTIKPSTFADPLKEGLREENLGFYSCLEDLDANISNDARPKRNYGMIIRKNRMLPKSNKGIILVEQMIYHLMYHHRFGHYLQAEVVCSGSVYANSWVLRLLWDGTNKYDIYYCSPGYAEDVLEGGSSTYFFS